MAPRSLNEPVRCRLSALSTMWPPHRSDRLRVVSSGVWRATFATTLRAARASPAAIRRATSSAVGGFELYAWRAIDRMLDS